LRKVRHSLTIVRKASIASIRVASITSIRKTSIGKASIGEGRGIVNEGGGGREDLGGASKDGGISISITPLPLSLGSLNSSKVSSSSLSNLRGHLRGNWELRVEGGGNKRLRAESGGNSIINRSNRQTGVLNTETSTISNISDLLELSIGINILVSSSDSSIGVSNLLFGRVEVSIAIVEVSKFILGMELASSRVRGIGGHYWGSGNRGSSKRSSSHRGSSIRIASIGVSSIAKGSSNYFSLLSSKTTSHKGRNGNKDFHGDVTRCVMLNDVKP